jgi:hypothetical protein
MADPPGGWFLIGNWRERRKVGNASKSTIAIPP